VFSRVAGQHFDSQRLGDQYGALLAGAWSLMTTSVPTDREALALIEQNNWEPYSEATEVPDERRCIDHVMQTQLRVDATNSQGHVATQTRTLRELVDHLVAPEVGLHLDAENTLGRHGIRVDMADGRATVLVSNTAKALSSILADTAWAHSWGTVLARLPGARKAGSVYFKGLGTNCRAIALPLESI
jgi:putative DNA primase/helicase